MSNPLINRFRAVQDRVNQACLKAERSRSSVLLLAVSKTKPIADIIKLAEIGHVDFGESYVQESLLKIAQRPDLTWHFIGPIQSNKTKSIAEHFSWVHSIDRLKIVQRLSWQRPTILPALNILLEVNINNEANKAGFKLNEVMACAAQISILPNLKLRGLMAIPQRVEDSDAQRLPFAQMSSLLKDLQCTYPNLALDTLSMGMSADLEAAIMEGATQVRIGTDIFGARD